MSITDTQRTNIKDKDREKTKTRMWADAQRNGRHAEYRGAIGESLVIPSLYHTAVWLTLAAGVPRSNAANI